MLAQSATYSYISNGCVAINSKLYVLASSKWSVCGTFDLFSLLNLLAQVSF